MNASSEHLGEHHGDGQGEGPPGTIDAIRPDFQVERRGRRHRARTPGDREPKHKRHVQKRTRMIVSVPPTDAISSLTSPIVLMLVEHALDVGLQSPDCLLLDRRPHFIQHPCATRLLACSQGDLYRRQARLLFLLGPGALSAVAPGSFARAYLGAGQRCAQLFVAGAQHFGQLFDLFRKRLFLVQDRFRER